MNLNDLSTNWKKLQESFKKEPSKLSKRKANHTLQPHRNGVKRREELRADRPAVQKRSGSGKSENIDLKSSNLMKSAPSASLALWAEENDISAQDLAAAYGTSVRSTSLPNTPLLDENINEGLSSAEAGKYISIDCEMVGVGPTSVDSALARISIVDYHGHQLYDSFVLPKESVTDYRTSVSGITPQLLKAARTFEAVQTDVAQLLEGRILVGHAIRHDLDALLLGHPKRHIRDTSRYPVFRQLSGGRTPSLKKLAREVLGVNIQTGEHSSVEDARAAMLLFRKEKEGFEREHAKIWGTGKKLANRTDNSVSKASKKRKKKKGRKR
ncbi:3'-5' exonuclease [Sticta canariensis]|nr:3'-5' exonuclease [Sticta canariensis]